jgi:hypothetical protein
MTMKINFFLIEKIGLLWDGIVTPGVEWIASQHTPARHKRTFDRAIFIYGLIAIMGARGIKPTGIFWQPPRNGHLI